MTQPALPVRELVEPRASVPIALAVLREEPRSPAARAISALAPVDPSDGDLNRDRYTGHLEEALHAGQRAAGPYLSAPDQMTIVGQTLLAALINHKYQHDQWIGEVRSENLGHELPPDPTTTAVCRIDGYLALNAQS